MRGSLATFVDIQEWASSTLKNSTEFNDFCTSEISSVLSFYSSFPFKEVVAPSNLPCIIFYTEIFNGSNISTDDIFRTWSLPFVIQIEPDETPVDVGGVLSWTSTKSIKKIAYKACEILEANACNIEGGDKRLLEIESLSTTDIDEADDLQAQVFVSIGQDNSI